jgi:glycosyltransferase involved in cell wall biosynthesis
VVTDIPSFRWMTDDGRVGALWRPGDAAACAAAIRSVLHGPWSEQSAAARRVFEQRLSFAAIGRQALAAYRELAARRSVKVSGA